MINVLTTQIYFESIELEFFTTKIEELMADLATYNKQALAQSEPQATINPKI